ncbi:MAG TPA: acyltransferase [Methylophilaceae bacterium]|nr:acyltransferase [Methylophilaceae bacterium]
MGTTVHQNNFGALRLLFASLVILSHAPEQIDGNRSREVLTSLFGTVNFGNLAVDGFFLISGYLITLSFYQSDSIKNFFVRRCLRIFPAFAVASLISIFIFAPMSGSWELISKFSLMDWAKIPLKIITLQQPWVEGAFHSTKNASLFYPLNVPMWTIRWEFLCYVSVPVFAWLGLHHKKLFIMVTAISMLIFLYVTFEINYFHQEIPFLTYSLPRLFSAFLIGAGVYLFRDRMIWSNTISLVCAIALLLVFSNHYLAEPALLVLGGYILFNFALNFKSPFLNAIGSKTDLSYGVYLYAWPIQILIILKCPTISPWILSFYVLVLSASFAFFSWNLIEKPFMQMKRYFQ